MALTYGYYSLLTWLAALAPTGVGFVVLLAVVILVVAVPWIFLKRNKKLDGIYGKTDSKSTKCGRWSDMLAKSLLKGVLQVTERCSHYLFENDSLKIQSSEKHGKILIMSGRTFKLSCKVLSSLVVYNCIVWGIIFSVAMNYLVVHETSHCDDNYDCFVRKDTAYSAQPLTNCSEISDDDIKCYYIEIRPAVAIALVGGFLKIVPPMVFYATTTLYLIWLKDFRCVTKIIINVILFFIFVGVFVVISVFTGLRPTVYIYENEERAAQVIVFLLLCICFTCWPWYWFERADPKKEEEAAGANHDSGSQEQICSSRYTEFNTGSWHELN